MLCLPGISHAKVNCIKLFTKIAKISGIVTSLGIVGYIYGPTFYYETSDLFSTDEHIGFGIFLDLNNIKDQISKQFNNRNTYLSN